MHNQDVIQKNWRMWKSGKKWLYASGALLVMTMGAGLTGITAHAQTADANPTAVVQPVAPAADKNLPATNDQVKEQAPATSQPKQAPVDKSATGQEVEKKAPVVETQPVTPKPEAPATTKRTPQQPATESKDAPADPSIQKQSTEQPQATAATVTPEKVAAPTQTAPVKDSTKVVIHYQGDGSKWVPYVWGLKPNGNGQQYDWTGTDDYGSYANIDMDQNYQQVGVLIKGADSWDKDGAGENRTINVADSGKGEVWYKQGSDDAQTVTPTYNDKSINVHYHDKDADNVTSYKVWTDQSSADTAQTVAFDQNDDYGNKLGTVKLTDANFKTIFVQTLGTDQVIREFTPLDGDDATDIYLVANDQQPYYTASFALSQEMVTTANLNTANNLTVAIGKKLSASDAQKQLSVANHTIKSVVAVDPDANGLSKTFTLTTTDDLDILQNNTVSFDGNAKAIDIGNYVRSSTFDDQYYYAGDDLGATYTANRTQIKLWAPTANHIELRLYDSDDNAAPATKVIEMQRGDKGVWTSVLNGDYKNWAYDYQLHFGDGTVTTTDDPYARAVTINGTRSVIEDVNQVKPADFNRMPSFGDATNAVIYETSVRDFTKDPNSGVTDKGKFLGMVESGTHTASGQVTGLDYLKDLGVTHVQLMPMYDFASVDETSSNPGYNWGYDPKNYNVPEGSYSTDASDPTTRIMEMKEMINGYHKAGIRVVMDVVYNHVYSMGDQAFQKVVPGYYFQYDAEGHVTNGTGVGNDVASERKMVRKYILDSVKYWASEYNIDGFRFDLMGILDVDTMNAIRAELNAIDPGIMVYGEGWDMRATNHDLGAAQYNADKVDKDVGFFSDDIRNAIKGAEFGGISKGLVEGNGQEENYNDHAQAFVDGFLGGKNYANATTSHPYQAPTQTINYVACHDNRTLYDMLTALMPEESEANLVKRDQLATSMAMLAEGVPFVNAGQEALRTKGGDDNSYQSSDTVNAINWDRVQANQGMVNYFKQLVNLRKGEKVFRLTNYDDISKSVKVLQSGQDGIFAFEYLAGGHKLFVLFNVNDQAANFDAYNLSAGRILLTSENGAQLGNVTNLAALSTLVVREDLPQTLTVSYCDQNGTVVKTEVVTLADSTAKHQLTAPTGYQIVGGTSEVSYDVDSDSTAWSLNIPVEKLAVDPGDNGQQNGGNTDTDNNTGNNTGTTTDNGGDTNPGTDTGNNTGTTTDNGGDTNTDTNTGHETNPGTDTNTDNAGTDTSGNNQGNPQTNQENTQGEADHVDQPVVDNHGTVTSEKTTTTEPTETTTVIKDSVMTVHPETDSTQVSDHENTVVKPQTAAATLTEPSTSVKQTDALPQTDESAGQTASLFGLIGLMVAGLIGLAKPKRKHE